MEVTRIGFDKSIGSRLSVSSIFRFPRVFFGSVPSDAAIVSPYTVRQLQEQKAPGQLSILFPLQLLIRRLIYMEIQYSLLPKERVGHVRIIQVP
jgi:hypothetical protein